MAIKQNKYGLQNLQIIVIVQLMHNLQTAAVISDRFSSDMLEFSHKQMVDERKAIKMTVLLQEVESRDIIELVHSEESTDKHIYRFTHPFLRTMLY